MGEGGGSCLRDYAYHKMIAYRMVLVRFFWGGDRHKFGGSCPSTRFWENAFG